jgi:hypothetical protein
VRVLFSLSSAQPNPALDVSFTSDPYLEYRPPFARSLPVQILLTGVVLTLTAVLLVHLMFTAQYHWPLAPVNYVLQLSGVTTLLISLIATIHVVLSTSREESQFWPYMLSYIAVDVPPDIASDLNEWTTAERATWLVMTASTSGLIQVRFCESFIHTPLRLHAFADYTHTIPNALIPISSRETTHFRTSW